MNTETGEVYRFNEPMDREKRRRMERADAAGQLAAISEDVARQLEAGQAAIRKAERKAAKASRKRNR